MLSHLWKHIIKIKVTIFLKYICDKMRSSDLILIAIKQLLKAHIPETSLHGPSDSGGGITL